MNDQLDNLDDKPVITEISEEPVEMSPELEQINQEIDKNNLFGKLHTGGFILISSYCILSSIVNIDKMPESEIGIAAVILSMFSIIILYGGYAATKWYFTNHRLQLEKADIIEVHRAQEEIKTVNEREKREYTKLQKQILEAGNMDMWEQINNNFPWEFKVKGILKNKLDLLIDDSDSEQNETVEIAKNKLEL
jgi:hypothetical protein